MTATFVRRSRRFPVARLAGFIIVLLAGGSSVADTGARLQVSATVERPVTFASLKVEGRDVILVTGDVSQTVMLGDGRVVALDHQGMACVPADPSAGFTVAVEACWDVYRG